MTFTEEQVNALKAKLDCANVKQREGPGGFQLSYLEGWFVIQEANRIFGFDGWCRETLECVSLHEPYEWSGKQSVSYRARVRITVGDVVREGTGFGSGQASNPKDAHELAIKEAETDAMKRAFMTFGNPFGLALYDKSQENVTSEADAYMEAAEGVIQNTLTSREGALQWWKDEAPHRRQYGLTQNHVDALKDLLGKKFPAQEAA